VGSNKDVGQGRMEIVESVAPSKITLKLDFVKPFEAHNLVEFTNGAKRRGDEHHAGHAGRHALLCENHPRVHEHGPHGRQRLRNWLGEPEGDRRRVGRRAWIRPVRETVCPGRIASAQKRLIEERSMARTSRKPADRTPDPTTRARRTRRVLVMVATRKGAWLYHSDAARKTWRADGPHFLGHIVSHVVLDPRNGQTLLAAAKTGHLGPTVFRSTDRGRKWKEAARPPAFAKAGDGEEGRAVDHTFWLTPGHAGEPHVWYAGTSPQGLFRSADG